MAMAKHDWTEPDYDEEPAYVPEHFTRGCLGCDGEAETEEEDDFWDDEDEEAEAPSPLEVTLATGWCFECGRKIDPLGWFEEHLDRVLWIGDEALAWGLMVKERINSPELNEHIERTTIAAMEYVIGEFDRFVKEHAE